MFERFTRSARTVVEEGVAVAVDATASEVRPEHLLLAILGHESCLALEVLEGLGAPAARVRAELDRRRLQYVDGLDADDAEALQAIGIDLDEVVRRIDENLGGSRPSGRHPRFSRGSKKVLQLSLREALALRHDYIGTEHLLLGLLRSGDRVVADSFTALGVDGATVRAAVADATRRTG